LLISIIPNAIDLIPGTRYLGLKQLTQDWRFEHNLFVPPVSFLIRIINYINSSFDIRDVLI